MGRIWPKWGTERLNAATAGRREFPEAETTVSIGRLNPSIHIVPLRRTHHDANCVDACITIHAGMFQSEFAACLSTNEMSDFGRELAKLAAGSSSAAGYRSKQDWLAIDVEEQGRGRYLATCTACDDPGRGNRLTFKIEIDRSQLEELRTEVDGWLKYLPAISAER